MSKFTSIEELFDTAEQSVGPPTEGGNGNEQLRVFQPDRGIDLTYNNPNFINSSSFEFPNSTKVTEERDNRQTLGTVTLNNRDYWENSNFDENVFQSYVKGKIETALNTRPIIDDNEEEIVFNESFDVSSTYRYSIDALPFVTDVNNDDEIIRLDRYYDKQINPTEYNLATEGKINYYLYPRASGRTPSHNIETYGSKQKYTGGGGKNRFDFYISQSISIDREDTGYYLFRLDWGDGTQIEHTSELKLLEGTTLLEHFYEKPGFYSITGLVCAIYEGRIIGGYEKFQTNILLNPSENYELKLYDFSNFATIGGLSSDSSLVKSTANIMGLNPLTLNQENESATPKLVEKLNLLDRLTIFNFLNKINSELNNNFTSLLNPYSIEISDSTEPLIDEIIFGCIDVNANNFVANANTDDGSCDYNFNIDLQIVEQGESLNFYPKFIDGGLSTNESETITNDKGEQIVVEGEFFYEFDILDGENVNQINSIDLLGDSSLRPRLFVKFEIQGQAPENLIVLDGESRSGFRLQQIIVIGGDADMPGNFKYGWYSIDMTIEPGPENFGDGDLLFKLAASIDIDNNTQLEGP